MNLMMAWPLLRLLTLNVGPWSSFGVSITEPFTLKPTVPVGVTGVPASMSLTVSVHVVVCPGPGEDGVHNLEALAHRNVWGGLADKSTQAEPSP